MPEYVVKVKSEETLSGFELALLEAKVADFFIRNTDDGDKLEVKAEYR